MDYEVRVEKPVTQALIAQGPTTEVVVEPLENQAQVSHTVIDGVVQPLLAEAIVEVGQALVYVVPTGEPGAPGARGPIGVAGPIGPQGPAGPPGALNGDGNATHLAGIPVSVSEVQNTQLLSVLNSEWKNIYRNEITDGGNF